jgi:hypothetical protein
MNLVALLALAITLWTNALGTDDGPFIDPNGSAFASDIGCGIDPNGGGAMDPNG